MQFLRNSKKDHNSNLSKLTTAYNQLQKKRNLFSNHKGEKDIEMKIAALDRASLSRTQRPRAHFLEAKINDLAYALDEGVERLRAEKVTVRRDRRQWLACSHELTYLSLISFRQCQPKDEHESINYSEINSRRVDFRLGLWEELSYILDIENIFYLTRWYIS